MSGQLTRAAFDEAAARLFDTIDHYHETIDPVLYLCDRPLRPDLAALHFLCQRATAADDYALMEAIVSLWDALGTAEQVRLRREAERNVEAIMAEPGQEPRETGETWWRVS